MKNQIKRVGNKQVLVHLRKRKNKPRPVAQRQMNPSPQLCGPPILSMRNTMAKTPELGLGKIQVWVDSGAKKSDIRTKISYPSLDNKSNTLARPVPETECLMSRPCCLNARISDMFFKILTESLYAQTDCSIFELSCLKLFS